MRRAVKAAYAKQPPVAAGGGVQTSVIRSLPAPVRGWNARDPLAEMNRLDAVVLENWWPQVANCVVRGGALDWLTGFAVNKRPKTLAVHNGLNGTNKLFVANDDGIYDSSAAGALGAIQLARTNGYHMWVQMAVSGGSSLIMVNGVDKPAYFDGAAWVAVDAVSAPALTGVATTSLISVNIYGRRLFFVEKDKLNFWYLAADAIGGALTEFLLGPLCAKGGFTMGMGTWTVDGGNGPKDYACFITSEGEVVIFTGSNPSDPNNWALVGVYFIAKPIGRKCFKKMGGDLILLTEYGIVPISRMIQSKNVDFSIALSNKIDGAFTKATTSFGANTGWGMEIYPAQAAFIVNVPTGTNGSGAEQYVMNTTTKSWCKFTGWVATDFVVYNKELYYAGTTKVVKAWNGLSDFGTNIVAKAQCAFTNFGDARQKDWGLYRPMLQVNGSLAFSIGVAVDFEPTPTLSEASYTVTSGAVWDVSRWDAANWAAGLEVLLDWRTPGAKMGEYGAGMVQVSTNSLTIQWAANDYSYTIGAAVT